MRTRPTALAAIGLVVMSVGVLRAQDQKAADEAFRAGQKALDEKQWAAAVTAFQGAIKIAPAESPRKVGAVLGMGGTEYLPHFFLGKAYLEQTNCTNALDAWGRSEQAGVIAKVAQKYRELQAGVRACEQKGFLPNAKLEGAVAAVAKQIETARAAADDTGGRAKTSANLLTPDRRNRLNQLREEIKQAESHLEAGRRSRAASELTDAQNAAVRAITVAAALRAELAKASDEDTLLQRALVELDRAIEQGQVLDRAIEAKRTYLTDSLTAVRQKSVQALTAARRVADSARAGGGEPGVAPLNTAAGELSGANAQLQRVFDELVGVENSAIRTRNGAALRQSRDKFRLADQAIGIFDGRVKARPSVDPKLITERQAISRRLSAARRQLEATGAYGTVEAIEEAGKVADRERSRLVEMTSTFGALTLEERGVNALLVEATRLFLNGDYAQVLTVLRPAEPFPPDMLFLEHVHVLRAAALHAQYLKAGSADAALAAAARVEIAALKTLSPAFQPDVRAFSPRFLEFFRTVPAAGAPQAERPAAATSAP